MEIFLSQFLKCGTVFAKDQNHIFIGYGKREWGTQPSTLSPSWYFPDFFLKCKAPWFSHQFWEIVRKEDLQKRLPKIDSQPLEWINDQAKIFENSFISLKAIFAEKKLSKAVPYLFHTSRHMPKEEMILKMLSSCLEYTEKTSLQPYGFWDENEGILGATPEILFSIEAEQLRTMACAGTLPKEKKIEAQEEAKLMKEHSYVVEGIANAIKNFGSSLLLGETKWQTFQHLKHLLTPIELSLNKSIPFSELVEALHPTAAIGTFPKDAGQTWLQDLNEIIPRKRFGAPCACVFKEKTLCLVAIRNVQWEQKEMRIAAGSGIIAESNLEEEKSEIELKIQAIKGMLQL